MTFIRRVRPARAIAALALMLVACRSDKALLTAPPLVPAYGSGNGGVNVAAAANGATIVASSSYSTGYAAGGAINGDRNGANWGTNGGWNDATSSQWPDWLEVTFASSQTIDEVDVFSVQDNFQAPVAPTLGQTFSLYGLTDFRIEAWDGSAWVVVPNGTIAGNNLVWRQVTFTPVTTTKIRLWVTGSLDMWSRVTEIEAYTAVTPGAFNKTTPTSGTSVSASSVPLTWPASTGATSYEYCVDSINNGSCDANWVSTTSLSATLTTLSASTTYYWQVRARNAAGTTDADGGTWWSFATAAAAARVNVAAAANGGTALASSTYSAGYATSGAIDGDRAGTNWGSSGGWNDATPSTWPDWLEVDFATSQTIGEIDVFSVQDNYQAPVTPTLTQTFSLYGLTDFRIEAWNGSAWVAIPNGSVAGNTQVWKQLTFTPVTTTKIRLWVTGARDTWTRVTEIEAYTAAAGGTVPAAFNKTSPLTGTSATPGAVTLTWPASTGATSYEYCIDTSNNAVCDASWVSTTSLSATLTTLAASTTYYWAVRARNATGTIDADGGTWWSFAVTSLGTRVNVAAAATGATVLASSTYNAGYAPSGAINGDRAGANWGNGGGWNDGTSGVLPDWLEVTFATSQTIDEVDVFSVQDTFGAPVSPTAGQTFSQYGLTDFRIEAWNGSAWITVPNGTITANNLVWRQVTFSPVTTTKIRLWVTGTRDNWTRVTEIEAYATLVGTLPSAFSKASPATGTTLTTGPATLTWPSTTGATSYEYCVDTINNNLCDASWVSTASLSATLNTLSASTTYYWQVRARNALGTTDANGGTWWSVTTATPSLNLAVENVYLTQATQRLDGTVSMVANRDALLRVFVTASSANTLRPDVRVRIYDGTTLLQTVTLPAPETSVRTVSSEGVLSSTWNTIVPAVNVRPNLRVLADVDPTSSVGETDRTDNVWPRSGTPASISVTTVPTFNVRFVPVTVLGVTGGVSDANKEQFLATTRRIMPINTVVSDVRTPFTSSAAVLQSDDANSAWLTVLNEMNALRSLDGAPSNTHYYGVVHTSYTSGVAGYGYVPGRAAMGWDYLPSGDGVAAHEWGHNFSRPHTPCAVSGDAAYPYAGGVIGAWGWNSSSNVLVSPNTADIMGYCTPKWISDWTWSNVMTYRQASGLVAAMNAPDDGLLVWGRVVDGRVMLEPAFRVRAPITPSTSFGTHRVQLLDAGGATLVDVSVNADHVDHELTHDERQFAVVLPWSATLEQSLAKVRVSDVERPLLAMERSTAAVAARDPKTAAGNLVRTLPEPRSDVTRVDGTRSRIRWNARDYPLALVRDVNTGETLGFVRNADAVVTTNGRRVEVVYSDGVRSVVRR